MLLSSVGIDVNSLIGATFIITPGVRLKHCEQAQFAISTPVCIFHGQYSFDIGFPKRPLPYAFRLRISLLFFLLLQLHTSVTEMKERSSSSSSRYDRESTWETLNSPRRF